MARECGDGNMEQVHRGVRCVRLRGRSPPASRQASGQRGALGERERLGAPRVCGRISHGFLRILIGSLVTMRRQSKPERRTDAHLALDLRSGPRAAQRTCGTAPARGQCPPPSCLPLHLPELFEDRLLILGADAHALRRPRRPPPAPRSAPRGRRSGHPRA